jgi:hypothetical protein
MFAGEASIQSPALRLCLVAFDSLVVFSAVNPRETRHRVPLQEPRRAVALKLVVVESSFKTSPKEYGPKVGPGLNAVIVSVSVSVSLPVEFVAVREGEDAPAVVGVPVMAPVEALMESPAGSPVADQLVMVPVAEGVKENACPTVPLADCPGEMTGGGWIAEVIVKASDCVSLPAEFVAVRDGEDEPAVVGVPEIKPVEALIANPAGRLLAAQFVIVPVEAGVKENACPTVPLAVCPEVIISRIDF